VLSAIETHLQSRRLAGRRPRQCARSSGIVARAECGGLALGDKAPVRLTSRGGYDHARLVSSALAKRCKYWLREGRAFDEEPTITKAVE
jgi:hypothetical protein